VFTIALIQVFGIGVFMREGVFEVKNYEV